MVTLFEYQGPRTLVTSDRATTEGAKICVDLGFTVVREAKLQEGMKGNIPTRKNSAPHGGQFQQTGPLSPRPVASSQIISPANSRVLTSLLLLLNIASSTQLRGEAERSKSGEGGGFKQQAFKL